MDLSSLGCASPLHLVLTEELEVNLGYLIFFYSALTMLVVFGFAYLAKKGIRKDGVWRGLPALLAEHVYLFLDNMATGMMGPRGRKYVPFLLALWYFIFIGNLFSLVFNQSPTADWSLNISMAVITMVYVQYEGIKANGVGGHLLHFSGPKLTGVLVLISVFLFMIEIVSELMKLFSLSIRLFGNIHGGHILISSLNGIVPVAPILGGLLLPIKLFTCVIQAFVWVLLTAVYLSLVTSHEEPDHIEALTQQPATPAVAI